jgi:hypothetical protein
VAVYPEGTITRDKALWPMQGKTGAARIALTTGAPVIPVAQWGAQELLAPYAKRPRLFPRKTMKVLAGPPVDLDEFRGRELTAEVLRGATDRIMDAVTELLAKLRDEPAPPREQRRKGKNAPGPGGHTTAGPPEAAAESDEAAAVVAAPDAADSTAPAADAADHKSPVDPKHPENTSADSGPVSRAAEVVPAPKTPAAETPAADAPAAEDGAA